MRVTLECNKMDQKILIIILSADLIMIQYQINGFFYHYYV